MPTNNLCRASCAAWISASPRKGRGQQGQSHTGGQVLLTPARSGAQRAASFPGRVSEDRRRKSVNSARGLLLRPASQRGSEGIDHGFWRRRGPLLPRQRVSSLLEPCPEVGVGLSALAAHPSIHPSVRPSVRPSVLLCPSPHTLGHRSVCMCAHLGSIATV